MNQSVTYFVSQPTEELTCKLTGENILLEIQSFRTHLMQVFWMNAFEHIYAYQIPAVQLWLNDLLIRNTDSIVQKNVNFSYLEASVKQWFVYRKDNLNLFGPLAWTDILVMKKNEILKSSDVCFSIKENIILEMHNLPDIQIFEIEKEQAFYFQRREQRFSDLNVSTAYVNSTDFHAEAQLFDFSEHGASIVSKQLMQIDDVIELSFYRNVFGKEVLHKHKAKIRSVNKSNDEYRYGLMLLDKGSSTLEQIRKIKKSS